MVGSLGTLPYNNVKIEVYSSGLVRLQDTNNDLRFANGLKFNSFYPGGLYGTCSFFVPRRIVDFWAVSGAQRLAIRNNTTIVWEGDIDSLDSTLQETSQGVEVTATGHWGTVMKRRRWRKRWADTRLTEDVWVYTTGASAADKCFVDRNNQIKFVPKAETWANNEYAEVKYTMPTGETCKRITFDYDMQEGGQQWNLALYNVTAASFEWQQTTSGTGSQDITFATPTQSLTLAFQAKAGQTPTSDGTYYGKITNLVVYGETGAIDMQQITIDIIGKLSSDGVLNSDTSLVGANTYSLVPFIADRFETVADILVAAGNFGDGSQNPWYSYLIHSEKAASPDGAPVLVTEQRPSLDGNTAFDYGVRLEEKNLVAPLSLDRDFSNVWNWIVVEHVDARGFTQYVTPDDDSSLTDADSVSDYDQRDYTLSVGEATQAMAINFGARFLARHKDPEYRLPMGIKVKGYIRAREGTRVPASEIMAGKRVRIQNFQQQETLSGSGLTFLISSVSYDADREISSIQAGPVDLFFLNLFSHPMPVAEDRQPSAESTAEPERHGHWEEYGYTQEEWQKLPLKGRLRIRGIT